MSKEPYFLDDNERDHWEEKRCVIWEGNIGMTWERAGELAWEDVLKKRKRAE